jgi:hypothetical protein
MNFKGIALTIFFYINICIILLINSINVYGYFIKRVPPLNTPMDGGGKYIN